MHSMADLRHLINWADLPDAVWDTCLKRARQHRSTRQWTKAANEKALGLIFFNPSLRTRMSMELAAAHLGATPTVLTPGQGTWNLEWRDGAVMNADRAEHVRDAVGVLGRYVEALGVRTFAGLQDYQADRADALFQAVVASSPVPVINLESARWHPCQALADAAALDEHFEGAASGKRFVLTWAPHPNPLPRAVPNSALLMAVRQGMEVVVARPEGYALDDDVMSLARTTAAHFGGSVSETKDQAEAVRNADVVYAKAWAGDLVYQDRDAEAVLRRQHADWTVTADTMAATNDGVFMHCLPVRRGVVVADEVLDGDHALHLLQAEYRLHAQKAILEWIWDLLPGAA